MNCTGGTLNGTGYGPVLLLRCPQAMELLTDDAHFLVASSADSGAHLAYTFYTLIIASSALAERPPSLHHHLHHPLHPRCPFPAPPLHHPLRTQCP